MNLIAAGTIDRMETTLRKVETLTLFGCYMHDCFDAMIDRCSSIRRLQIDDCDGPDFNRGFPNWECFGCDYDESFDISFFLERNPNIRKFASHASPIWDNQDVLMTTANIKLDELAIWMDSVEIVELRSFCRLLNELHERGFYKRSQLYSEKGMNQ